MYTQCPDCGTAFRVTAEVLKQAAGKVRCGGCRNAFNALLYLSETKPETKQEAPQEQGLPELSPESAALDAEPGAAVDDIVDELDAFAGEDVQFEDTGVEWRLLGDDEDGENDDLEGDSIESALFEGDNEADLDEVLEVAPTPVDEYLTETPSAVEAAEVFAGDEALAGDIDAIEVFEPPAEEDEPVKAPEDELRFDDNTGLPDDFFDDPPEPPVRAETPRETALEETHDEPAPEAEHVDIAFGEADEWGELLDEVATPFAAFADDDADAAMLATTDEDEITGINELAPGSDERSPMTLAEELDALPDDDDDEQVTLAAPGDVPLDLDTQFNLQALSMGIEVTSSGDLEEQAANEPEIDEATAVLADPVEDEAPAEAEAADDNDPDDAADIEEILAEAAAEPAAAESQAEDVPDDDEPIEDLELEESLSLALEEEDLASLAADADESAAIVVEQDAADEQELDTLAPAEVSDDIPRDTSELQFELDKAMEAQVTLDRNVLDPEAQVVPPQTEEEQTVNMLIDEDLMRLAITDEDGMASTIVFENKSAAKKDDADDEASEAETATLDQAETGSGFETIIMEGEFARTALEQERLAAEREARDEKEAAELLAAAPQQAASGGRSRRHYGIIAGIVVLALLLAGQFVHQSRAELATIPAVGSAIEPVYRAVGAPIAPDWDVTGWRFEATRGSTDPGGLAGKLETDEQATDAETLTVWSRIGNQSTGDLPYPLISIALTDRFEETIGSTVLEPSDYLPASAGAGGFVAPGENFEAVIRVASPSARATGFKLNVCYRQADARLRCAVEDFR